MIPRIKKPKDYHKWLSPRTKWIVETRGEWTSFDLCDTFGDALRYWLWHCGVPAQIAFGWFKKKKDYESQRTD